MRLCGAISSLIGIWKRFLVVFLYLWVWGLSHLVIFLFFGKHINIKFVIRSAIN